MSNFSSVCSSVICSCLISSPYKMLIFHIHMNIILYYMSQQLTNFTYVIFFCASDVRASTASCWKGKLMPWRCVVLVVVPALRIVCWKKKEYKLIHDQFIKQSCLSFLSNCKRIALIAGKYNCGNWSLTSDNFISWRSCSASVSGGGASTDSLCL